LEQPLLIVIGAAVAENPAAEARAITMASIENFTDDFMEVSPGHRFFVPHGEYGNEPRGANQKTASWIRQPG